ncbi:MAG: hypothetical protein OHK0053_20080 [Microscillaceae bacterium]
MVLVLLCSAFVLRPGHIAQSTCGGYDADYYSAYSFFSPLQFGQFYQPKWDFDNAAPDNLTEWQTYCQNQVDTTDLRAMIYASNSDDLDQIEAHLQRGREIAPHLAQNGLVQYWKKGNRPEMRPYLRYAKQCEIQAWTSDEWQTKTEEDYADMRQLANQGRLLSQQTSDITLKLRYAYQAIRMAHYGQNPTQAVAFYEELIVPLWNQTESTLRYWALGHYAGALKQLGQEARANYLFSRVFELCPSKRTSALLSVKIKSQEEWEATLAFCQQEEEKATLYFMRALDKKSQLLEEMKSVYSLSPDSEKLNIMLVQFINRLEFNLLSTKPDDNLLFYRGYQSYPRQEAIRQLLDAKAFVEKVRLEEKNTHRELWTLAEGYLDYLAGTPQKALQTFANLKKSTRNRQIQTQIEVVETALALTQLRELDEASEERLYQQVKKLDHENLKTLMLSVFARLYEKQGQAAKAYLCLHYLSSLKVNPRLEIIEGLIALTNKKNTSFEREMLLVKIDASALDDKSEVRPRHFLQELKATVLFSQDKLSEAVALYEQLPEKVLYPLPQDPFFLEIEDCQECPPSPNQGRYNRLTLAKKLLILKNYADQNTVEQASYYYQLGTAYYNMSYFGNSWMAIDYFWSASDIADARKMMAGQSREVENAVFADCAKARYYFDRAITSALKSGQKELAAQACFMAAKCEQNQYYLHPSEEVAYWLFVPPSYLPEHRRNFTRLKNEFGKTKFYQKALRECKYFHEFLN